MSGGSIPQQPSSKPGSEPTPGSGPFPTLQRKLGLTDATTIGLGSMIGAGIFAAFAPAAEVAGAGLLLGLAIAAVIAYCNATSSAQLAAQYPTSGGTYIYGRERLGPWPGFLAGWSFVIGKTASCAAMALTFAAYAAPSGWAKPVAALAVLGLVTVNYFGVTRTAQLTRIIVIIVLAVLVGVVVLSWWTVANYAGAARPGLAGVFDPDALLGHGWYAIAQSAGLLFFAFAGYARIATMGEEVTNPKVNIPRAILTALAIVLGLYAIVAITALAVVGPDVLASSSAPLLALIEGANLTWAPVVVKIGAALASLGALLALIAGVGRTSLAMARNADLPKFLAGVHPKYSVPHHAELTLGAVVIALIFVVDLRGAIGFSSFGVLLYYFIANLSAFTQTGPDRAYGKWLQIIGAVGCLILVATLPLTSILIGIGVLAVGVGYRMIFAR